MDITIIKTNSEHIHYSDVIFYDNPNDTTPVKDFVEIRIQKTGGKKFFVYIAKTDISTLVAGE